MYDDLMVMAAFRYCLGRRTYIVSHCVEWFIKHWDNLESGTRYRIERELCEEIVSDNRAREREADYLPLGDDCDRESWVRLYRFIGEGK